MFCSLDSDQLPFPLAWLFHKQISFPLGIKIFIRSEDKKLKVVKKLAAWILDLGVIGRW